MTISNPSLGWERLGDVFYRARDCFNMQWGPQGDDNASDVDDDASGLPVPTIDLDEALVSVGPYASHIAMYADYSRGSLGSGCNIDIYSGSGALVSSLPWLHTIGEIVALGWTDKCGLIVVMRSGRWRSYYNFDGDFTEHDLNTGDSDVAEVKFWPTGFAVRLANDKFKAVLEYDRSSFPNDFDALYAEDTVSKRQVFGWAVVPPSVSRQIQFLVSTDSSIVRMGLDGGLDDTNYIGNGPYEFIAFPPGSDLVALYSQTVHEVTIATADFKHVLNILTSDNLSRPVQFEWCSNDAVIVDYKDEMKLVGPTMDPLNFYLESPAVIKPEDDGIFFLSKDKLGFLSRVNDVTQNTFKIGSTAPSAILLDAIDLLDKHSPKANENIEIIGGKLIEAVDGCIRAAAEEFEPYWQKTLMRAAAFGKISIELYDPTEFVETANALRVLNIIRQPEIGVFLTNTQLSNLGFSKLIQMLLLRRQHYLCLKLADFLNLPKDDIYLNWAECKIKVSSKVSDDDLTKVIIKRLSKTQVSFASIAEVAYQEGRRNLAVYLLNRETETARSVPLLLEMDQDDYALQKSEDDLDVDSMLYVLITLFNKNSRVEFFKIMDGKPYSVGAFKANLTHLDDHLINDYYYQDDYIPGLASLDLQDFFDADANDESVETRKALLSRASKILSRSKSTEWESARLKSESKLIEAQVKYRQKLGLPSKKYEPAMETVGELAMKKGYVEAVKFAKDQKIPEKQYYYKILKTLAPDPDQRNQLYEFATSRKSPIGYQPFFLELYRLGDMRQASMYVGMCNDMSYQAQVKCYLDCGDHKDAIDLAAKKRDVNLLEAIKSVNTNQAYARMIDDALEQATGSHRFG